jgi:hypothetical protein
MYLQALGIRRGERQEREALRVLLGQLAQLKIVLAVPAMHTTRWGEWHATGKECNAKGARQV